MDDTSRIATPGTSGPRAPGGAPSGALGGALGGARGGIPEPPRPASMVPRTATPLPTGAPANGAGTLELPPRPGTLAETAVDPNLLEDLALRTVASCGTITGTDLAARLRLPLVGVVEQLITTLRHESLVEPLGGGGNAVVGAGGVRLRVTERGAQRAQRLAEQGGYVGPAPVPLATYHHVLQQQVASRATVTRELIWRRLGHLVLADETVDRIGVAIESGQPLLLFGHPGNGKSAIAAAVARALTGGVLVPFAAEIDGQIVRIFDPSVHRPIPAEQLPGGRYDERWMPCRAPFVPVGGELRPEHLDLAWSERQRYYDAPAQLKAAGGVLLIDELGRQQYRAEHLLNRWIVPLETGVDSLSLATGRQVTVPFTAQLIFATNLELRELADEAFLRRLPCKVLIPDPSPAEYREICRRLCADLGIEFVEAGFAHLIDTYYARANRGLRASHPRDLLRLVATSARYYGVAPQLTPRLVDAAAELFFI